MAKPVVCVVGRPNVGKSTFFNKIVGKRISIEQDTPGVTRDRVYAEASWLDNVFTIIDTGGIEFNSKDNLTNEIKKQAEIAINFSDVILFMVDAKDGLTSADEQLGKLLRRSKKKVILLVNKIDNFKNINDIYEFYKLGYEPMGISSINNLNFGDVLDKVVECFEYVEDSDYDEDALRVAIVGKPNVGKSSLLNVLSGDDRAIVSNIAGTTREAIDELIEINGKKYIFTDTAGIRKKNKVKEEIESYSVIRSYYAIERSDIAILVVDAKEGFSEQDKRIIGYAHNNGKGILVLVNKWDLIEKENKTYKLWKEDFYNEFAFLKYALIEMVSVLNKNRTNKIIEYLDLIQENRNRRISTGQLNDLISEAILLNSNMSEGGSKLRVYYCAQVDINPPKFVLFINYKKHLHFSYLRYLENKIRQRYDFNGTPIVFDVKEKGKRDD